MDVLSVSIEIIKAIVDLVQWVTGKLTGRPKITSQRAQEVDWNARSSLLSMALKPVEPIPIIFTNHSLILLALLVVGGLMVKLNLDG